MYKQCQRTYPHPSNYVTFSKYFSLQTSIMSKEQETGIMKIGSLDLSYELSVRQKTKSIRLTLTKSNLIKISIPDKSQIERARQFIRENQAWLLKRAKKNTNSISLSLTKKETEAQKSQALIVAKKKLLHFNQIYHLTYKKIAIGNQKTRWGSASQNGTLTFNVRIAFLPEELQNYLIVHELCHLKEMNHGPGFWRLVARTLPNYKALRKELKRYQIS